MQTRIFTILDTKNRNEHTLPLPDFVFDLLNRRLINRINDYVFPSRVKKGGHLVDPQKYVNVVIEKSGTAFILHDLRRTFLTIAHSLDIPYYALKRLVNHSMRSDVTAGYVILDIEGLRKHMQKIADYILVVVGQRNSGEVVSLEVLKERLIHE